MTRADITSASKQEGVFFTMKKFRISFYTGPSVYDSLLFREYIFAKNVDEAEEYAKQKGFAWYEITEVKE